MKTTKLTIVSVITAILALWEVIYPTVEVIFGVGSRGLAIASLIITSVSFVYNRFYPNESLLYTAARHIGIRPHLPPPPPEPPKED